jgi:hypothetical protein
VETKLSCASVLIFWLMPCPMLDEKILSFLASYFPTEVFVKPLSFMFRRRTLLLRV